MPEAIGVSIKRLKSTGGGSSKIGSGPCTAKYPAYLHLFFECNGIFGDERGFPQSTTLGKRNAIVMSSNRFKVVLNIGRTEEDLST
jgi:hypothetical protein